MDEEKKKQINKAMKLMWQICGTYIRNACNGCPLRDNCGAQICEWEQFK